MRSRVGRGHQPAQIVLLPPKNGQDPLIYYETQKKGFENIEMYGADLDSAIERLGGQLPRESL